MKIGWISRLLAVIGAVAFLCRPVSAEVLKIVINDTIQPVTEEYIARAIDEAHRRNDQAVLIELNTPGGLLSSTRAIIEKITTSTIPVILYVAPNGSRAGSAGIFLLESADVAAMAPGTNAGAAHPVLLFGPMTQKPDEEMGRKIENDAAALMRSVVSRRGSVEVPVRVDPGLREGLAFMTLHFQDDVATNLLTIDATDPKSGTAEFKATAIRIEKLEAPVRV